MGSAFAAATANTLAWAKARRLNPEELPDPYVPLHPKAIKGLTDSQRAELIKMWERGIIKPNLVLEQSGLNPDVQKVMSTEAAQRWRKLLDTSSMMFNTAESIGRMSTAIAILKMADADPNFMNRVNENLKDNNIWQDQVKAGFGTPTDFAQHVIDEGFGVYGKQNRAAYMRRHGSYLFQFMTYPQQMIELMVRMAGQKGTPSKKALAFMVGALILSGGLQGLPGAEDLKEIAESTWKGTYGTELDLDTELRELAMEAGVSQLGAEMISRGVLRSMGVDVARRIALGNLPAMDIIKVITGARSDASDALGVPGSITLGNIHDFARKRRRYGSFDAAMRSFLPSSLKNLYEGLHWNSEGVRTGRGNLLIDRDNLDDRSVVLKMFGFNPGEVGRAREKFQAIEEAKRESTPLTSDYYARLALSYNDRIQARRKDDQDAVVAANESIRSIRKEIAEYNRGRPRHQRIVINRDSLLRRIREFRTQPGELPKYVPKKARRRVREIHNIYTLDR
jgi:hypothetical protein